MTANSAGTRRRSTSAASAVDAQDGPDTATPGPGRGVLWAALAVVYVVWGSTYLAIRVVVEDMPPMLSASARFATAAVLMGAFLALRSGPKVLRVRPRELGSAALVGVLLLALGNGGVTLGERTVPSGLAALLVAVVPLWVILLRRGAGEHPRALSWIGVLVGFAGLTVLVLPGGGAGGTSTGIALIIGAALCWSIGSFGSQRLPMPANPFVATVWEMAAGAAAMFIVGLVRGEQVSELTAYSRDSWIALAYLVVFGSIVAFSAYVWLLQNAPISLVATYAYVNPVVAVFLGALILDEVITGAILLGGAIVVVGVALVVGAERPKPPPPNIEAIGEPSTVGAGKVPPAATGRAQG